MAHPVQQQDIMCGMDGWRPKWMQQFATAKHFLIIFGLLGTIQAMGFHYFTVTLTTVEKRFKVPSYATGIALSGNEISEILFSLVLSYFCGKRNRPKWIAWSGVISAFSCFILASAHVFYGPGEDAIKLTAEYMSALENKSGTLVNNITTSPAHQKSPHKLCMASIELERIAEEGLTMAPLILIFISQFVYGIGTTLYYTLGSSYLDDGSSKKNTPMMMAYALAFRIFGLIISFGLVSAMMRIYIDPWSTPLIEYTDPRWLGAWWLGWLILGTAIFIFSLLVGLYPEVLPKKKYMIELRRIGCKLQQQNDEHSEATTLRAIEKADQLPDNDTFFLALRRMLTNRLLMYNSFGTIFYVLGSTMFITFYSKYLEVQFNKSSADSDATLISGPVTIVSMISGILCSGYVISKYQPPARILFFFNIVVGVAYIAGQFGNLFLSCETGSRFYNETGLLNLTSTCNMQCACTGVPYSPVCDEKSGITYFSPCHAGCQNWSDSERRYFDCKCAATDVTTSRVFNIAPWPPTTAMPKSKALRTIDINVMNDMFPIMKSAQYENLSKSSMNPGACVAGCGFIFMLYTLISCVINWLGSAARVGNLLLNFRAIPVRDKSFALGVVVFMLSVFAFIPGPIIFGYIIDSTCLIWNENGGRQGNCQMYDQTRFRYHVNLFAMLLTFIGTGFEVLVWWHARHLELYRDDDQQVVGDDQSNETDKR